jgi:hypothetical protein
MQKRRPLFDLLTRVGAKRQLKKMNITFHDILINNSLAADNQKKVPDNLLLVCQK